jgi:hypothetical protein
VVPEEEMREIFERAAALEAKERPDVLTMGAVEQVAAEIGIPPERVREAALGIRQHGQAGTAGELVQDVKLASDGKVITYPSSPDVDYDKQRMRASRFVPVELPESKLPDLVPLIEDALDLIGHASIVGRTLTWSPAAQGAEGRHLLVTIRPREGGTEIHLDERIEFAGWRLFAPGWGMAIGAIFGTFVAMAIGLHHEAILLTALPSGALGGWMMTKGIGNTMADTRRPGLQKLLERLSAAVESKGREQASLEPGEKG